MEIIDNAHKTLHDSEQIKLDEERMKLMHQIESLERQMRSTARPRRQRELYAEIKKLKSSVL